MSLKLNYNYIYNEAEYIISSGAEYQCEVLSLDPQHNLTFALLLLSLRAASTLTPTPPLFLEVSEPGDILRIIQ